MSLMIGSSAVRPSLQLRHYFGICAAYLSTPQHEPYGQIEIAVDRVTATDDQKLPSNSLLSSAVSRLAFGTIVSRSFAGISPFSP